jgi:tetratricopeptide (TPR) repeat protein
MTIRLISLFLLFFFVIIPPSSLAESDLVTLATDAYSAGEYESALMLYDDALRTDPFNETLLIGKFSALSRLSRWDEVVHEISVSGYTLSDNPDGAALLAEGYTNTGKPEEALSLLDSSHVISDADDLRIRSEALIALQRDDEAFSLLKNSELTGDLDPRLSLIMGTILSGQGNMTAALPYLETAFAHLPYDPDASAALGSTIASMGMYEEALIFTQKATDLNPDEPKNYVTAAYLLNHLGRYDEALIALDQAIDLNPSDDTLINARAYTLYLGGHYEEALTFAQESLRVNPDDPAAMDTLGSILLAQGETETAVTYLIQAADLLPGDPEVLTHLADTYHIMGKDSQAQDLYQRALRIDLSLGRAWRGYSEVLLSLGRYPEAATTIAETFRHYPGDAELIAWEQEVDAILKEWYLKQEPSTS